MCIENFVPQDGVADVMNPLAVDYHGQPCTVSRRKETMTGAVSGSTHIGRVSPPAESGGRNSTYENRL